MGRLTLLPPELKIKIASHLLPGKEDLAALCCVSHEWRSVAEPMVYYSMNLLNFKTNMWTHLSFVLNDLIDGEKFGKTKEVLLTNKAFEIGFLKIFKQIVKLHIQGEKKLPDQWAMFRSGPREEELNGGCWGPAASTLTELKLHDVLIDDSLMPSMPNLRTLGCARVRFYHSTSGPPPNFPSFPQLKSYTLVSCYEAEPYIIFNPPPTLTEFTCYPLDPQIFLSRPDFEIRAGRVEGLYPQLEALQVTYNDRDSIMSTKFTTPGPGGQDIDLGLGHEPEENLGPYDQFAPYFGKKNFLLLYCWGYGDPEKDNLSNSLFAPVKNLWLYNPAATDQELQKDPMTFLNHLKMLEKVFMNSRMFNLKPDIVKNLEKKGIRYQE